MLELVRDTLKLRISPAETPVSTSSNADSPPASEAKSPPVLSQHSSAKSSESDSRHNYNAFLVMDIEGTCEGGVDFDWPNEIIELPVCLLRWKSGGSIHNDELDVVNTFRTYVKPVWKPRLSEFCTDLTGIMQDQVDTAPTFPQAFQLLTNFLCENGLIDADGNKTEKFCWCTDGRFDIQDFMVKQCFISQMPFPKFMKGDIIDTRMMAYNFLRVRGTRKQRKMVRGQKLTIENQLRVFGLGNFEGRQHSGIDDTRNIARVLIHLASKGQPMEANFLIDPSKRWAWMGQKPGEILDEKIARPLFTSSTSAERFRGAAGALESISK